MEESQVTIAEQNRDDMNNLSQETPSQKHERSSMENKSVIQMNLIELRIIKAWEKETSQIDTCHSSKALFQLFKISTKRRPLSFIWHFFS